MADLLGEDDPRWDSHSGRDLHDGAEWTPGDRALAEAFYARLAPNARLILDLMMRRPGEQLDADFLAGQIRGRRPGETRGSHRRVVSGSLSAIRHPAWEARRSLPFRWWQGQNGAASLFAMRPSVAAVFLQATAQGAPGTGRPDD